MKRFVKLLCCSIAAIAVFTPFSSIAKVQEYQKVNVVDIMTLKNDSVSAGVLRSPMYGDTVLLTGLVTVAPLINYPSDKRPNMTIGNSWVTYLRDINPKNKQSCGICVIQTDTNSKTTLFERVKAGDIIEVLVRIGGYPVTNNQMLNRQFPPAAAVITGAMSMPVKTISSNKAVPPPTTAYVSNFYTGGLENRTVNFAEGSKFIGMKVELSDLIVVETTPTIIASDQDGNTIYITDQSAYYKGLIDDFNFKAPIAGQRLKKVIGYVSGYSLLAGNGNGGQFQNTQVFSIAPSLPNEIEKDYLPAQITGVARKTGKLFPGSGDTVQINFDVAEGDNSVDRPQGIKLMYTTDKGVTFTEAPFKLSQFGYTGSIPPLPNHTIVGYKITVVDDKNTSVSSPFIGVNLYKVIDEPTRIADFQKPITGYNGTLEMAGNSVTIEATVTADNKDLPGGSNQQNPSLITMQDGPEPWSGFVVGAQILLSKGVDVHQGDKVRITGTLQNYFGITTLENVESVTVISSGNTVQPGVVSTADIGGKFVGDTSVHRWRAMLVEVRKAVVMDAGVASQPQGGEFSIADKDKTNNPSAFLRVETDASPLYYTTHDSIVMLGGRIKPQVGREFDYVRGLVFGGNQFYKLVPRSTSDFAGLVGVQEIVANNDDLSVSSYPNPVSTEARIEFSIKQRTPATVRVIDILGNIVQVLVNEQLEAGSYSTNLNTAGLTRGVYQVEVLTGYGVNHKSVLIEH